MEEAHEPQKVTADTAPPATVDLRDIEILAPGTYDTMSGERVEITEADIDDMVAAFKETSGSIRPPLRLGHSEAQEFARAIFGDGFTGDPMDFPSLGWVSDLRKKGTRAVIDAASVPVKVAEWIKTQRYGKRSAGVARDKLVNGKTYRRFLHHVALLGAAPPAVPGLADIGLSDGDAVVVIEFAAPPHGPRMMSEDAAGQLDLDEAWKNFQAQLDDVQTALEPLIRNRQFAPRARALLATFRAQIEPIVAGRIQASSEGEGNVADVNLADAVPVQGEAPAAPGTGMTFDTAEGALTYIAAKLDVNPSDFAAIVQKVVSLVGAQATGEGGETSAAAPGTEQNMSDGTLDVVELSASLKASNEIALAARAEVAEMKARLAMRDAEALVDAEIAKGIPPSAREDLVFLAATDVARFERVVANMARFSVGEKGTADAAMPEGPSEGVREVARLMGAERYISAAAARAAGADTTPKG